MLGYAYAFYGSCDVRIAPSRMLIEELRTSGYRKAITYLPNAVPVPRKKTLTAKERTALCKRYGLKGKIVLHVGRLSYEKSVDVVLKAFALLAKSKTDESTLLIVGDGPHRKKLQALAKTLGISRRTVFTGFIPPSELLTSGLFSVSDVFVTASTMESQGMVAVEAMAFGVPIVAVAEGAIPEVVGEAGILVRKNAPKAIADAVKKLFADPRFSRQMAAKSLRRHRLYSLTTTTNKLLRVYARAIERNRKAAGDVTSRYLKVRDVFRRRT